MGSACSTKDDVSVSDEPTGISYQKVASPETKVSIVNKAQPKLAGLTSSLTGKAEQQPKHPPHPEPNAMLDNETGECSSSEGLSGNVDSKELTGRQVAPCEKDQSVKEVVDDRERMDNLEVDNASPASRNDNKHGVNDEGGAGVAVEDGTARLSPGHSVLSLGVGHNDEVDTGNDSGLDGDIDDDIDVTTTDVPRRTRCPDDITPEFDSEQSSPDRVVNMAQIGQLAITKPAPEFECNSVVNGDFKMVKLSDYRGKYVVLFFYPLDFTFVCPTEIIAFSDRAEEFRAIGCEILACSTDSVYSHLAWIDTPRKQGGLGPMKIPLMADKTQEVARKYGCLKADEGVAFRGLFIIDDRGNLRQMTINDLPVGRSVDETLRLVQAFQFTDKHGEVCPAGWKPGKETMKPNPKESQTYFKGVN